jgi:DNA repair protein RadD
VLRWYQEEAVQALFRFPYWDEYNRTINNPVIAMPTGTGKSHVIGALFHRIIGLYPQMRGMMLTHVKELIQQDLNKFLEIWPLAPVGVYSASLKRKDTIFPITFGGVASVVRNVAAFGHIDFLGIDECHLVSDEEASMYVRIITELRKVNPYLKVFGLSATIYRLGMGYLTEGNIFSHVAYDVTGLEAFNRLIAEGYISPLIPKRTRTQLDIKNVGISKGDYKQNELQAAVDKDEITRAALEETCQYGQDRRSWMIFASGIDHACHCADMLNQWGITAAAVHSKTPHDLRDKIIAAYKAGQIRALCGMNVFTTGFDHPMMDLIACIRPTLSPVLWVQMLGRGTRPSPETFKQNCLVLDFAGNTKRLGPINDPIIPRKKGEGGGPAPTKLCTACDTYNHISVRFCVCCGAEFSFEIKITETASTEELIKNELPVCEWFDVQHVVYSKWVKGQWSKAGPDGKAPPTVKVEYFCNNGLHKFNEYIGLEHGGLMGKKARDWWRLRHWSEPPKTTDDALNYISELRAPKRILVHVNKQYPQVLNYEW